RDWQFTWQRVDRQIDTTGPAGPEVGLIRLDVVVHGDRAEAVKQYLSVPSSWAREDDQSRSMKALVEKMDKRLGYWPLVVIALLVCIHGLVRRDLQWRTAVAVALVGVVIEIVNVVNGLPATMLRYDTRMS